MNDKDCISLRDITLRVEAQQYHARCVDSWRTRGARLGSRSLYWQWALYQSRLRTVQRVGGSTKCTSIENGGGGRVRGEVVTGGWGHPERSDERRIQRPHRRSKLRILGCGGREKERAPILWIGWRGRTGGGMKERDGHVLLNLFARKLHSRLCSCLASA